MMDDEDSILFQAMKEQMNPQAELAAMKMIPPGSPYQLGLEMRQGGPGGVVTNPMRSAQQPTDFAGRPAMANDNPARVRPDVASNFNDVPVRPSGNVVNQYQSQWQDQKYRNMINQAAAQNRVQSDKTIMETIKDFFNKNRPGRGDKWWD
jgi:hypothetical protein